MAHSVLQSSPNKESFAKFQGCLVTMFGGHARQRKSSATSSGINTEVNQISEPENRPSKIPDSEKTKLNKQEAQIYTLQNQNTQLKGLLDPTLLVDVITQAVTTSLKISSQSISKGGAGTTRTGYVSKPYFGKPQPSQLAPGADESLNPDLDCWYCKDTSHLKENCIKLNHQLAQEQKKTDPNNTAPTSYASKLAN